MNNTKTEHATSLEKCGKKTQISPKIFRLASFQPFFMINPTGHGTGFGLELA
jgi:hypothetical protein